MFINVYYFFRIFIGTGLLATLTMKIICDPGAQNLSGLLVIYVKSLSYACVPACPVLLLKTIVHVYSSSPRSLFLHSRQL